MYVCMYVCIYIYIYIYIYIHTLSEKKFNNLKYCSLASVYNLCILRSCNVSVSFVMVISDKMVLMRPVLVLSVLTLQAVTVVFSK